MDKPICVDIFLAKGSRVDPKLSLIAGQAGLSKEIKMSEINRPGLALAGHYDHFGYGRVQLFGLGESAYLKRLSQEERVNIYEKFFSYDVLCCIFTHNEYPDELFCKIAEEKSVPVFVTARETTSFVSILTHFLYNLFSPEVTLHATLVDVFGIGVLLMGESSVGKSECALELLERGHKLVADDMVKVKKVDEALLMGSGSSVLKHYMEIRGLGILNARDLWGMRSVLNRKRIELVACLEQWKENQEYERLGLDENTYTILEIDVPYVTVPVRPGRNIPVIIEAAALNQHLRKLGINSARQLDESIKELNRKHLKNSEEL